MMRNGSVMEAKSLPLSGVIENMPYEEQVTRMGVFADSLVHVVQESRNNAAVPVVLEAVAAGFRTSISQVKYGLSYALNTGMLKRHDSFLVVGGVS